MGAFGITIFIKVDPTAITGQRSTSVAGDLVTIRNPIAIQTASGAIHYRKIRTVLGPHLGIVKISHFVLRLVDEPIEEFAMRRKRKRAKKKRKGEPT